MLARSVKTEKRTKCGHSLRSREFPDGLTTLLDFCRSSNIGLSRIYQSGASTAVVIIVLPEQSRVVHVLSGLILPALS